MSNSNLIPTPIVDKNGRQTTVRRKAGALSIPKSIIPLVTSARNDPPRNGEPGTAFHAMNNALLNTPRLKLDEDTINKVLSDIRPETLNTLDELSGAWHGSGIIVSYCAENAAKERSAASFNNLALFHYFASELSSRRDLDLPSLISGLQAYNRVEDEVIDYTNATDEQVEQARALLKVVIGVDQKHLKRSELKTVRRLHLSSPNLVEMIQSRPEDADRLIAIMNQHTEMLARSPKHIKELESMLDQNITNTLIDGIL